MQTIIRDETDGHLFGVDPVKELEWALRDWSPGERAEFHEFILVNGELSAKRVENELYNQGGTETVHNGIDSRVFWLPEAGMVGVFDISRDYDEFQEAARRTEFRPVRNYCARAEYRFNMRCCVAYDAYKMLAAAQLMIIQRNNSFSENQARRKVKEVHIRNEIRFFWRIFPTLFLNLPLLVPSMFRGLKGYRASKNNHSIESPTALDGAAELPSNGTSLESNPKLAGAVTRAVAEHPELETMPPAPTPDASPPLTGLVIQDQTGEVLVGVDPAKVLRWVLQFWPPEERAGLTRIILVGDDIAMKQAESKLLRNGARPMYRMQPEGCTYAMERSGATQIINIVRHRNAILPACKACRFPLLRAPFTWFYYRTRLRSNFSRILPYGLAYARIAEIERKTKLSGKELDEKSSYLYWDIRLGMAKRIRFWIMLPQVLLVGALLWVRDWVRKWYSER